MWRGRPAKQSADKSQDEFLMQSPRGCWMLQRRQRVVFFSVACPFSPSLFWGEVFEFSTSSFELWFLSFPLFESVMSSQTTDIYRDDWFFFFGFFLHFSFTVRLFLACAVSIWINKSKNNKSAFLSIAFSSDLMVKPHLVTLSTHANAVQVS